MGGGAGKGLIDAFGLYDCGAPTCEMAKGLQVMIPEKLDWTSVLTEEAGGVYRSVHDFFAADTRIYSAVFGRASAVARLAALL